MNKLTEREKELIKWITFLLDVTNKYALFVALIRRDFTWLDNAWASFGITKEQEKMVEALTTKFGLDLNLKTNVDGLKKMEEIQRNVKDIADRAEKFTNKLIEEVEDE